VLEPCRDLEELGARERDRDEDTVVVSTGANVDESRLERIVR
jgi:hypothetical protein